MSKRDIASLACKILGIFMFLQGINVLGSALSISVTTLNQMSSGIKFSIMILPFTFLVIFGVLLWVLSDKFSEFMVNGKNQSEECSDIKISDIQRVSFSVLGLFFIGDSLPQLVSTLTSIYSMSGLSNSTTSLLVGAGGKVTQLVVGLGIFFGSQGLVSLLDNIRHAGLKRE